MSATYANVTVVGADHDDVVAALGGTPAFVSETVDGVTVVFSAADEEAFNFGEGVTAAALSSACHCRALEVSVFEEQVFQYRLFADGDQLEVGIVPTPLARQMAEMAGGELPDADGTRLVAGLGRGDETAARAALSADEDYPFASARHAALAAALSLPTMAAGAGFTSLSPDPEAFAADLTPVGLNPDPEDPED